MRTYAAIAVISILSSPALAADWSGQAAVPSPVTRAPGISTVVSPFPGYVTSAVPACLYPSGSVGISNGSCPSGTSPSYFYTGHYTNVLPDNISASGSSVSVPVEGAFPDANSLTGVGGFQGSIPLSEFATSSSVTALEAQLNDASAYSAEQRIFLKHFAAQGVAQSLAMAGVGDIDPDQKVSLSMNFGTFEGQSAAAVGIAVRLSHSVSFNAGMSGMGNTSYGARFGLRVGW